MCQGKYLLLDEELVHVAISPSLSWLERANHRVLAGMEMLRGVLVL
jgi:hypothetical protein